MQVGDVFVAAGKALQTGYVMAKEADRKYQISDKLIDVRTDTHAASLYPRVLPLRLVGGQGVKTGVSKAQELNAEYRVTERLGAAALQGLDRLADLARGAGERLDAQRREVEQRTPK